MWNKTIILELDNQCRIDSNISDKTFERNFDIIQMSEKNDGIIINSNDHIKDQIIISFLKKKLSWDSLITIDRQKKKN